MSLSNEDVQKYKEIYKKEFNKELADEEAFESGTNLLNLFRAVYCRPSRSIAKPKEEKEINYGN